MALASSEPWTQLPYHLGPYRLDRTLGRGGMGEVYEAWDQRLRRHVAVKRLSQHVNRDRLLREAQAAARLDHPAIVHIHDVLQDDTGDWLIMERVAGQPLSVVLERRGPLPVEIALELGRQICDGLECAHRSGIVHRDLKTENVLVDDQGRAKIIDFGIATHPDADAKQLTGEGRVIGTARAMSPEQTLGRRVDARSDLFSLGVLLYESLTGSSPFLGHDADETMSRVCEYHPPSLSEARPEVPKQLSDLVARLLEKDPSCRPPDSGEVQRRLSAVGELHPDSKSAITVDSGADSAVTLARKPPSLNRDRAASAQGAQPNPPSSGSSHAFFPLQTRSPLKITVVIALLAIFFSLGVWGVLSGRLQTGSRSPESDALASADPSAATDQRLLRVVVMAPQVLQSTNAQDPESETTSEQATLLASGLEVALQRALLHRTHLTLVSAAVDQPLPSEPGAAASLLGADAFVSSRLTCSLVECSVTLERIRGSDGTVESISNLRLQPHEPALIFDLANAYVTRLFPDHSKIELGDSALVPAAELEHYLDLRRQFEAGTWAGREPELVAEVADLRNRSPGFIEAYVFEARLLRLPMFRETQEQERARSLLKTASSLDPNDPRPYFAALQAALGTADWPEAQKLIERLEVLQPGDPMLLTHRAKLAAGRGLADEAVRLQQLAVERRPTWSNLYELATLQHRSGQIEASGQSLQRLLESAPNHLAGLWLQAQLELLHGDPKRAALLYQNLANRWPGAVSNQGVALLLSGDPTAAIQPLQEALALAPDRAINALNLADALWLQGETSSAERLYHRVLNLLAAEKDHDEPWQRLTIEAQALAHLGRRVEAAEAVRKALPMAPNEPQLALEVALVYALLGEQSSALVNARRALELGVAPVWFRYPWFDELRADLAP